MPRYMNPNLPRLRYAEYAGGFRVRIEFIDDTEATIDLEDRLYGPIFEPLKDVDYFAKVRFDKELNTIVWPNDADFAPEFLYERALAAQKQPASA